MNKKKDGKILYYPEPSRPTALIILGILAKYDLLSTHNIGVKLCKKSPPSNTRLKKYLEQLIEYGYCTKYNTLSNANHNCDNCGKSTWYVTESEYFEKDLKIRDDNKKARDKAEKQEGFESKYYFPYQENYLYGELANFLTCLECGKWIESHKTEQYKIQKYHYWSLSNNGRIAMLMLLNGDRLYRFIQKHKEKEFFELINVLLKSQKKELFNRVLHSIREAMRGSPNVYKIIDAWYRDTRRMIVNKDWNKDSHPLLFEFKEKYRWRVFGEDMKIKR